MRPLALLLLLGAAGCATDEDAAGTQNPDVVTPAEVPPALGEPAGPDSTALPPDSATTLE